MNNPNFILGNPHWASAYDLEAIQRIADELKKSNQIEMNEGMMAEKQFEPEEHVDNVMDGDSTLENIFEDSMLSPIPSPTSHVAQSFGGLELGSEPQAPPPTPDLVTSGPLTLKEFCHADTKTTRSSSRISNRRQCSLRPPKSQFETKTPRYRLKKKELKAMPPEQKIDHIRHQNLQNSAKYRQRQKVKLAEKGRIVEELEVELKQAETESLAMENEYKARFETNNDLKAQVFDDIQRKRLKRRDELENLMKSHEAVLQGIAERRREIMDSQDLKDHQKKTEISTNGSRKSREMGYLKSSEMVLKAYELSTSLEQHAVFLKKLEHMFGKIPIRSGAKDQNSTASMVDPPQDGDDFIDFTTGCNTGATGTSMPKGKRTGRRSTDLMAAHTTNRFNSRGRAVSDSMATHTTHPADMRASGAPAIRRKSVCLDGNDHDRARPDTKRLKELEYSQDRLDVMAGYYSDDSGVTPTPAGGEGRSKMSTSLAVVSNGGTLSGRLTLAFPQQCDRHRHDRLHSSHSPLNPGEESAARVYPPNHGSHAIRRNSVRFDDNDWAGPDTKRLKELESSEDRLDVMAGYSSDSYFEESNTENYSLDTIRGHMLGHNGHDGHGLHNYQGDLEDVIRDATELYNIGSVASHPAGATHVVNVNNAKTLTSSAPCGTEGTGVHNYQGDSRDSTTHLDGFIFVGHKAHDGACVHHYQEDRGESTPHPGGFSSVINANTYENYPLVTDLNVLHRPLMSDASHPDSLAFVAGASDTESVGRNKGGLDDNDRYRAGPDTKRLKELESVTRVYPPKHGAHAIRGEMAGHYANDEARVHNHQGDLGEIIPANATGPNGIGSVASHPAHLATHVINVNNAKTLTSTVHREADENDPLVTDLNARHHPLMSHASHSNALAPMAGASDTESVGRNMGGSFDTQLNESRRDASAAAFNKNDSDAEDAIAIRGSEFCHDVTIRNGESRRNVLAVGPFGNVAGGRNVLHPSRRDVIYSEATGHNENDPLSGIPMETHPAMISSRRPAGADVGAHGTALRAHPAGIGMSAAHGLHRYNGASYRTPTGSNARDTVGSSGVIN
ncbi:hypothetical protein GCK72_011709 [Caenorhabditis remanei]|uniref:BZIP domain-containing protein n=1 Tax=Caenorhabditis remanei TaxID=31234 RepID=A0A6A5HAI3_CAERE|nr:hypothetical protein GCK72_011709 [Caenorhabditis remanei]KAF1763443.1 hypothetical protein GCK72_011709 [Caenorhabditis remanei]